jgi:phage terminase small subunit
MTPEQKHLFDQLTQLQQRVATNVLAGMSQRAAYYAAGGTAATDATADVMASRMVSEDKVKAFMDSMKVQAVSDAIMGREEMLARLSLFARKGIKDIVKFKTAVIGKDLETGEDVQQTGWWIPDSVLRDDENLSIISELEVGKFGPKIKTHSSLQAMAQIAKIQGYEVAGKLELTGKDGGPIQLQNLDELTDEQLAAIALADSATGAGDAQETEE